jgi:hypothetical protein
MVYLWLRIKFVCPLFTAPAFTTKIKKQLQVYIFINSVFFSIRTGFIFPHPEFAADSIKTLIS